VIQWAKAHYRHTESWPTSKSGPVEDAPGETWANVNWALRDGYRGLPGGQSLSSILQKVKQRTTASTKAEGGSPSKAKS